MSNVPTMDEPRREDDGPRPDETPRERRPYEPPKLTRIGNLRDLLGKTGTNFDMPNPHTQRP